MTTPPEIHFVRAESSTSTGNPPSRRTPDTIGQTALFTGVLFSGLFAGFLFAVLILEAGLRRFPASVYTQVRPGELGDPRDPAPCLPPAASVPHRRACPRPAPPAGAPPLPAPARSRLPPRNFHHQHAGQLSHQHGPTRLVC